MSTTCHVVNARPPSYDLRRVDLTSVRHLFAAHHGYGDAGGLAVFAFAVFEDNRPVAAYTWQPPPYGAARSVCPEAPGGVLALSRMVAVPKSERRLNHVSKPLRRQMRVLLPRDRWPVLITYSDEGQGHTGHVYRCSGWEATTRRRARVFIDADGIRRSRYSNGSSTLRDGLVEVEPTHIQRWEHWVCPRGGAAAWLDDHGWVREPVPGRVWRSGNQAFRWVQRAVPDPLGPA